MKLINIKRDPATLPIAARPLMRKMGRVVTLAHSGQKYGSHEYTYHLQQVKHEAMRLLVERGGTRLEILGYLGSLSCGDYIRCVALGHDLIEDTDWTVHTVAEVFGTQVAHDIDCVTKREGEDYYAYLRRCGSNPVSLLIKIADTICNLAQSTKEGNEKRIGKYTKQLHLLKNGVPDGDFVVVEAPKSVSVQSALLTKHIRAIATGGNINLQALRNDLISVRGTLESCEGNVRYMKENVSALLYKSADFIAGMRE